MRAGCDTTEWDREANWIPERNRVRRIHFERAAAGGCLRRKYWTAAGALEEQSLWHREHRDGPRVID
jgi:hypothetical protein